MGLKNMGRISISIHALREEGDIGFVGFPSAPFISIHALREEGDGRRIGREIPIQKISIHALREEGDLLTLALSGALSISIHALREEGDVSMQACFAPSEISIHALREEGDHSLRSTRCCPILFLSTPSARRATCNRWRKYTHRNNFYPRPPRGGRRISSVPYSVISNFYPRPPRGGRQQKQRQNLYFLINYTTFCTNLEEP